jgi:membrane-bound serine protease (ClpP class)
MLLLALAVVLFVLEVKITSYGLLSAAAIFCLVLGSIMLFDPGEVPATPEGVPAFPTGVPMRVSWSVLIPVVTMVSAFFIFAMGLAAKAWMSRPRTGDVGLQGEVGIAATDLENEGRVDIHGEYWNARSDSFIPKGDKVRVVRVEGLTMIVTKDFQ